MIMNRLRQIKVEKDNENNDIKRGGHRNHKAPFSARGVYPKVEVCNARLNRIKKALSNEYGMPITNCPAMTTIGARVPLNVCTGKYKSRNGSTRMGSLTPRGPNMIHNAPAMPMSAMLQQRMMMTQPNAYRTQQVHGGQQPSMRRNTNGADGGGATAVTPCKSGKGNNVESVSVLPLEFGKRRKMKLASAFLLPDKENKSFVYLCKPVKKVKEILTARELNDSTDNFKQKDMPSPSSATLCRERNEVDSYASAKSLENSTTDEFELAPLMPLKPRSSTSSSIAELSSARVFMNVRELLSRQQHEMLPEDLDTIKDVVKTDARYHQLQKDDELFKDILRTQLEEIRKQETLVETALSALEVEPTNSEHEKDDEVKESVQKPITEQTQKPSNNYSVQKSVELEKSESGVLPCGAKMSSATTVPKELEAGTTTSAASLNSVIERDQLNALAKRKKEIDLVLKNIPNLQREIKMLHAIGEKLESTLRSSKDEHVLTNIEKQSSTIYYTPCEDTAQLLQRLEFPSIFNGYSSLARIGLSWSLAPTRMAQTLARSSGICYAYGCIKEFRIEQKTLTELKNADDDNQWFYIPVNEDRTELKRTSFGKLKDNPDLLMQYLKPRSQLASFNLLEQDPMFLSGIMYTPNNDKMFDELSSSEHLLLHEGGDSCRSSRRRRSIKTKTKWLSVGAAVKPNTGLIDDKKSSKIASKRTHCCKSRNEQYFLQPCRCQPCPNMSDVMTMPTMDVNAMQKLFMQQFLSDVMMPPIEACGNMVDASTTTNPSLHKLDNKSLKPTASSALSTPPEATPAVVNVIEEKTKMLSSPVLPPSRVKVQKPNSPERLSGGKNQQQQQHQQHTTPSEMTGTSLSPSSLSSMRVPATRRSLRRSSTPLSLGHTHVEPKSHLLKTVIVGVVQITVFLLLIMAFTYPDVHC